MRDAAIDTHRSPARGSGRSRAGSAPPLDEMVGEGPLARGVSRQDGITSAAVAAQRLGGGRAAARGRVAPGLAARLYGRMPRVRPLKALTVGAFGVALVGIVANAMVFQRGHHPSPLFGLGRSVDGSNDAAQRTAAAVPAPAVPAPVEKTGTIPPAPTVPADPAPPPAAAAPPKLAPAHHAAKVHHEEVATARTATAAVAHPRPGHVTPARPESKPEKADAKADPVAKLLAGGPHAAKRGVKPVAAAEAASKPQAKPAAAADEAHLGRAAVAPAASSHHRLAAAGSKPATGTE